jgi:hypothetical protein
MKTLRPHTGVRRIGAVILLAAGRGGNSGAKQKSASSIRTRAAAKAAVAKQE